MKLLNKFYIILVPLFLIIFVSSVIINSNELTNRIDDAQENYINSNIEDALYLKNDLLFQQYFDNMQYDLKEEASIVLEDLQKLLSDKVAINKEYGNNINHILFLSKDKKVILEVFKNVKHTEHILKALNNISIDEKVISLIINNDHVMILPLLKNNSQKVKKDNINGFFIIDKKLQIENIELLKTQILTKAILTNLIYFFIFILGIYLLSRLILQPIEELINKIEVLKFEDYKDLNLNTDIKEFLFLNDTIKKMSLNIISKQNDIMELNNTLEEKVKTRTVKLKDAYNNIKQYKQLFSQNKAVMLLIEPTSGKIIEANDAALKFYGYSHEEIISKNIDQINNLTKEEILVELNNAKEEKREHFFFEHKLKDGTIRYVEVHSGPITIDNKQLLYSIINDITEQKKQEELLQEKDKMIQQQSKVAAVGEMLGNISHQWRQPLSIITTLASGLKMKLKIGNNVTKEEFIQCADSVVDQAEYLSKTIDDFRSFFMADTKTNKLSNLKTVFEKLSSLIKSSFENNYITYISSLEDGIMLELNENILIQSFINICNNAKDAFKENQIPEEERFFFINMHKEDNKVIIEFKDSAGGIDKSTIDKIFDPYFTTKHPSIGTGIGLYMTNQIITKQLKGTIEVKNVDFEYQEKSLRGAQFRVVLPLL